MHDGCPVACFGDAPFGYVNIFTSHVNVGFFQGASLPDPGRLLQGSGKFMRHVKLRPGTTEHADALSKPDPYSVRAYEGARRERLGSGTRPRPLNKIGINHWYI